MNYREFYIWLEGYLHNKLENEHISITPIVEKMSEVISDEQKWIDDFKKYQSISPSEIKPKPYEPPFDITC
jgi:hypothetical protein